MTLMGRIMTGDIHARMGGRAVFKGGGGGGTSSSGIDPEFKPALRTGLQAAEGRLRAEIDPETGEGRGAGIAELTGSQLEGLSAQERLSRDALRGEGVFDDRDAAARQLDRVAAQGRLQNMGAPMGSARASRAQQAALADAAYQQQAKRQQDAIAGAAGLQQAGAQRRAYEQDVIDAPHKSLDRYFGYLSGAPQQTTTSQSGGK